MRLSHPALDPCNLALLCCEQNRPRVVRCVSSDGDAGSFFVLGWIKMQQNTKSPRGSRDTWIGIFERVVVIRKEEVYLICEHSCRITPGCRGQRGRLDRPGGEGQRTTAVVLNTQYGHAHQGNIPDWIPYL